MADPQPKLYDTSDVVSSPKQAFDVLEKKRKSGKPVDASFFRINSQDAKKGLSMALAKDRAEAAKRGSSKSMVKK